MNMNDGNLVGSSISTNNSFPNMASRNIHVLLVEDESRDHDYIINLLNYFSYKVTSVNVVSRAMSILLKGKEEFDVVMANINSQDSLELIQLLHHATKMKLLVMFMSNVDDDVTSMRALDEGAFLCVRKPLSMEIAASLWQLVMSERATPQLLQKDPLTHFNLIEYYNNNSSHQDQHQDQDHHHKLEFQNYYNVLESDNKNTNINSEIGKTPKKSESYRSPGRYKRKVWTEWTLDLHHKFMAAARFLGQGKCYPKDILEIMNEPGLTRMQVASHLQKCRNANWLPPNERKVKTTTGNIGEKMGKRGRKSSSCPCPRAKTIRFGVMPFWDEECSEFHQTTHDQYHQVIDLHQEFSTPETTTTTTTHDVLEHDDHQSSNSPYLVHGLHPCVPDHNTALDEQFIFGHDYHQTSSVVPHTNLLPNIVDEDAFDSLPMLELNNNMVLDDLPHFQKELEMDFDKDWDAFIRNEVEHDQVAGVAGADNYDDWFYDEAFNPFMEKEDTEQGQMKEGSSKP